MIFKLRIFAEKNRRRINGFDFLGKVITGVKFKDEIGQRMDKFAEVKSNSQVAA